MQCDHAGGSQDQGSEYGLATEGSAASSIAARSDRTTFRRLRTRTIVGCALPCLVGVLLLSGCGGSGGAGKDTTVGGAASGDSGAGSGNPAAGAGGTASAAGGSSNAGSANGGKSSSTAGAAGMTPGMNGGHVQPVTCTPNGERPATAPKLTPGVWVDITPPGVNKADETTMIGQGLVIDPCNPSVVYWGNTPYDSTYGGLFRSIDGGATWTKLGDRTLDKDPNDNLTTYLDEPLHMRIDPADNQHFYAGDGVRGGTQGFWVTHDGGNNWKRSDNWPKTVGLDIYDVAVDPTDFNHALATFHSGWPNNVPPGVVETKDGGDTWIVHPPAGDWGAGHSIKFLYDPEKGIGNANTWLVGTQGAGYWRTEDAGQTWKKVSDSGIAHGGGSVYNAANGYLYASGYPHNLRSKDNGVTWETLEALGGWTCIFGDGNLLYTGKLNLEDPGEPLMQSPETDGVTWTPYNDQKFRNGPYEMALDKINGVIYSSNWTSGVWTLKIK